MNSPREAAMRAGRYGRRANRVARFDKQRDAVDPHRQTPYADELVVRRAVFYGLDPRAGAVLVAKRRILSAVLGAVLALGLILCVAPVHGATGARVAPRAPSLQDARYPAAWLQLVSPHRCATVPLRIALGASDYGVYGWQGEPVGRQAWHAYTLEYVWRVPFGRGTVRTDGRGFCNRSSVPVLAAVWEG